MAKRSPSRLRAGYWGTAMLIEAYFIELPGDIYQVSNLTVLLMANSFALAVAFAQGMDLLARLYPAWKVSGLDRSGGGRERAGPKNDRRIWQPSMFS